MANTCKPPERQTKLTLDVCSFGFATNMSSINLVHAIHCTTTSTKNSLIYMWQNKNDITVKHRRQILDTLNDNVIKSILLKSNLDFFCDTWRFWVYQVYGQLLRQGVMNWRFFWSGRVIVRNAHVKLLIRKRLTGRKILCRRCKSEWQRRFKWECGMPSSSQSLRSMTSSEVDSILTPHKPLL